MIIGIDIGGTKCAVIKAEADEENIRITDKIRFETKGMKPNEAIALFDDAIEKFSADEKPKAIGISCGGPLDSKKGVIMSPPNLIGWDDVHITEHFTEKFGVPAYLENDANACALAEWMYGAGKGTRNMVFLTFGSGLGAGIILDGRLYSGTNGNAGECGHIRLSENGPAGYGKCGSFEGFCSGNGIASLGREKAREALQNGIKPYFCNDSPELDTITAKSIADAANEGDETAVDVYRISGEKLGYGLSILIDILNPEAIVIGSVFARSENLLRAHAEKVIAKEALTANASVCRLLPAALGEKIGDYAAIAIAQERS